MTPQARRRALAHMLLERRRRQAMLIRQQRHRTGWIHIAPTFVRAAFWGETEKRNARADHAYKLLKTPNWVWKDRTNKMRRSVRKEKPGNVVTVGGRNHGAPYAPFVERNPKYAPVRRAVREANAALP